MSNLYSIKQCHPANYIKNSYRFQLLEVCSPLAWLAGEKFSILCRCTSDGFGRMCDAYMKGCLLTDEMLEIHSMSVVDVSGTAGELLNPESRVSHQPCFPHTTINYYDSHCLQYLVGLHMPKWVRFWIPVSWCCCSISVKKIISILKQHHTSKNIHTYQKCSGEMKLNSLEELQHFIR